MTKGKSKKLKDKRNKALRADFLPFYFLLFTFTFLLAPSSTSAQDDETAPPPIKFVTKEERAKLDAEPDTKARTKLVVELMKLRIDEAEKLNAKEDFDGVFREFGHFRALLDYGLNYLQQQDANQNKTLDNYKRFEITLRAAAPRIEAIRRELPMRFVDYVQEVLIYIRDARRKASDALFSDTVLPEKK